MAGRSSGLFGVFIAVAVALAFVLGSATPDFRAQALAGELFPPDRSFVPISDRQVCSLLTAVPAVADILGQDGGTTVEAGGEIFWAFNDTWVLNGGGFEMLIPNNIARTSDYDAFDCVSLSSQMANGHAAPVLSRLPGENGVFPSGLVAAQPGFVHFFYASSVPDDNADLGYRIQGFGLARFDTTTVTGERLLGGQLIWEDESFPGAHLDEVLAFENDGYVYAALRLTMGLKAGTMLARTPTLYLEAGQFEYWNGSSWGSAIPDVSTSSSASAALLWVQPIGMSAPSIAYNAFLDKWVAVHGSGFAHLTAAHVAPEITGPWTTEPAATVSDCLDFLPDQQSGFICYMGQQHPVYARDGGRTIYVTWSNLDAYQTYLHEVRLGVRVRQFSDANAKATYRASSAPSGFVEDGVAFYASDTPQPGFAAIHRWVDAKGNERLSNQQPVGYSDAGTEFFAPLDQTSVAQTNIDFVPVFRWTQGGVERYSAMNLGAAGFVAQEQAFFGACPDTDSDELTDCAESFLGSDPNKTDTDGDLLADGFEVQNVGCDLLSPTDDQDGITALQELTLGSNPCVWDSGYWGCNNAPLRITACDTDTDKDRCRDAWELGIDPQFGGKRDPEDYWDYFNPTGDGRNRTDDVLRVIAHYYADIDDAEYSTMLDRGDFTGPNAWDLGPPDGHIRIDDILAAVRSYLQDCP